MGHIIDDCGISADPAKTSAILNMPSPQNVSDLRRFFRMVNQLGKFSSHLSELTHPLRRLLSSKQAWVWDSTLEAAFHKVKTALSDSTVLGMYTPTAETKISADVFAHGLGAVLLQRTDVSSPCCMLPDPFPMLRPDMLKSKRKL